MLFRHSVLALIFVVASACNAFSKDRFYYLSLDKAVDANQPQPKNDAIHDRHYFYNSDLIPFAVGTRGEEVYLLGAAQRYYSAEPMMLAIRTSNDQMPEGIVYLREPKLQRLDGKSFKIKSESTDQALAAEKFYQAKEEYFAYLLEQDMPGSAWFRHQMITARTARKNADHNAPDQIRQRWQNNEEFQEQRMYSLLSGGRAVSENLQLDRQLRVVPDQTATVDLNSINGINTKPVDWKTLLNDQKPEKDVLAAYIPADQHAIFFPSFDAMLKATQRADSESMPMIALLGRSEDDKTKAKYDEQLCLATDTLSRILGPRIIKSMAFTGSDPYMKTGSDMAVLFETKEPAILTASIRARHSAALSANKHAVIKNGEVQKIKYSGVVTPDRSICSYLSTINNIVIVTNSLQQLENIINTQSGRTAALANADEYTYFRSRYKLGEANETTLIVLSDAAIRRWCSPRWRIADARRTKIAATLAELQARHLGELAAGNVKTFRIDCNLPEAGTIRLTSAGVISEKYGSLAFMTPICELKFDKVTTAEERAYSRFRESYEHQWRQFFDPIALKVCIDGDRLAFDLTVLPLILDSEYQGMIALAGSQKLPPFAGDKHAGTIFHGILSLDPNSSTVREFGSFASQMSPGIGVHPFSWIGKWVTLYADDDPFWAEMAKIVESESYRDVEKNLGRLPLALQVDVANPFKLAAFITALRAFSEQSAPGMLRWETLEYNGKPYVKVGVGDANDSHTGLSAVYYCATGKSLTITLNEALLKRAINRAGNAPKTQVKPWLGESANLQCAPASATLFRSLYGPHARNRAQQSAWANIYILNEWHRLFPEVSAVEFHQRFWNTTLVCPGGGQYVWNDTMKTMESTVFGSPANPKRASNLTGSLFDTDVVDLGLTFENNGLRAKVQLEKSKK